MAKEPHETEDDPTRRGLRLSPVERRAQILEAATKLLSQEGLDAVRIRAVAEAAGVSPPVVYRHFFSREDLVAALAAELGRRNQEVLDRAVESLGADVDPSDVWRRSVDLYFDVIRELGPGTVRAMLTPTSEMGRSRLEEWADWVTRITDVPAPLAASLLHLSVPVLCSYAELWIAGAVTREQAVDLSVRNGLWHIEQLRSAAAPAVVGELNDVPKDAWRP